jgi:long-chain acyl-CoA synthetase
MKPTRLFDALDYQLAKFPKPDMLAAKEHGQWTPYSTQKVKEQAHRLAAGLHRLGVGPGDFSDEGADKVAIISPNRPEWVITDLGVQMSGAILVPIYPTTNPHEIQFILNEAKVQVMLVANNELLQKVLSIKAFVPTLKHIYTFDKNTGQPNYQELMDMADEGHLSAIEGVKQKITAQHLATIIYTSGTTGTPKGVMLTHENICTNVFYSKESFPFEDAPHRKVLSFLPLNHIFEKTCTYIYLFSGISIYYAESIEKIADNLREVKPDGFTTVPRLLEKVYEKIMTKGQELTGLKKKLFYWAVELGEQYDNRKQMGLGYKLKLGIANKLIFSKWREALGGKIEFIITGGAACQERLLRIFNAGGIPVYEGYGPTEHSPVICVNRRSADGQKFGTVGPPINHIELKLAEDGEILVRSKCTMKGYYLRPELTAETVQNGWLCTGDIGTFDGKFLKITDRKKEMFKTSGGKYVAPQPIESKLKEHLLVEQAFIIGPDRKFVSALLVPSFTGLKTWMEHKGLPFTTQEAAIALPEVKDKYERIVAKANEQFNHVEQIKRFALLPAEWTIDGGEMTPKMSIKRKFINEKYSKQIEGMYQGEG